MDVVQTIHGGHYIVMLNTTCEQSLNPYITCHGLILKNMIFFNIYETIIIILK